METQLSAFRQSPSVSTLHAILYVTPRYVLLITPRRSCLPSAVHSGNLMRHG